MSPARSASVSVAHFVWQPPAILGPPSSSSDQALLGTRGSDTRCVRERPAALFCRKDHPMWHLRRRSAARPDPHQGERPSEACLRPGVEPLEDRTLFSTNQGLGLTLLPAAVNPLVVNSLYQTVLQRPVDPTGLATWSAALGSGQSAPQAVLGILNSPEGRANQVQSLY